MAQQEVDLYVRNGVWYTNIRIGKHRVRRSTGTKDLDRALVRLKELKRECLCGRVVHVMDRER